MAAKRNMEAPAARVLIAENTAARAIAPTTRRIMYVCSVSRFKRDISEWTLHHAFPKNSPPTGDEVCGVSSLFSCSRAFQTAFQKNTFQTAFQKIIIPAIGILV